MGEGTGSITVTLFNDLVKPNGEETQVQISAALETLFSYADSWMRLEDKKDVHTLRFSSMLAAMVAGSDFACEWLRSHISLRGTPIDLITKGHRCETAKITERLTTTSSFRAALEEARRLHMECGSPAAGIDVRHFVAAYATVPAYHLEQFFEYRIDRRAWCLELADVMAEKFPEEANAWAAYARRARPVLALGLDTDAPEGRDLLGIEREAEAFAMLVASRATLTPLSIGVFGTWGSGKSFFMRRVRERVAAYAAVGRKDGPKSPYHGEVAQIEFNAWHYSEGNLIACLVDHVFRNLRFDAADEDDATLRKRSADLIVKIDSAKQVLAEREQAVADAEARRAAAQRALDELDANLGGTLAAKQRDLDAARASQEAARAELASGNAQLQVEIEAALAKAPLRAAIGLLGTSLSDPKLVAANDEIRALAADAVKLSSRWKPIVWGLAVIAIGAIAAAIIKTEIYAQLLSAATAVAGFAGIARAWLSKLDAIADKGEKLQAAEKAIAAEAAKQVTEAHKPKLDELAKAAAARAAAVQAIEAEITTLKKDAPDALKAKIATYETERAAAFANRAQAAGDLASRKAELARMTSGSLLGEFLDDRAVGEGYRRELTIFTQVRNDFERLSRLMQRATAEYLAGKLPPAVSRIVLYIDDLDRCPKEKVLEVLRAVHLLLAFPLFVCIVAVDPRWVTHCLENAAGLAVNANSPSKNYGFTAEQLTEVLGTPATATDYLEKIFQIPLWLRPIPDEQRAGLVRALLDTNRRRRPIDVPIPDLQSIAGEGSTPTRAAMAPMPPGRATARQAMDNSELDFVDRMKGLLDGNPRSLKRFVNTYRLLKTSLSDVDFERFLQRVSAGDKGPSYRPYRLCMAQLAVLCTQRTRALPLVRMADDKKFADLTLDQWFEALPDKELAETLRTALSEDCEVNFATFRLWLERTRRYSFYV